MNENIKTSIKYYTMCTKLKDTIRTGPKIWNANRERIESVAEHIWRSDVSLSNILPV